LTFTCPAFGSAALRRANLGREMPPRPSSTGRSPAAQASASCPSPPTTTRPCRSLRGSSRV